LQEWAVKGASWQAPFWERLLWCSTTRRLCRRRPIAPNCGAGQPSRGSSSPMIVYPRVVHPDILVAQAPQAVTRYFSQLKPGGTLIIDSDMVQEPPPNGYRLIQIPSTNIASKEIGNSIVTNLVILGVLIGATRVVSPEAMEKAIRFSVPKSKIDMNLKAFRRGLGFESS
jgi:2-oxoglutarate ferredoxin oxidoreductase subunit gamma